MQFFGYKCRYVGLALILASATPVLAADETSVIGAAPVDSGWKYQVGLDGWFTALDGSIGVRGLPAADVNVSALDAIEHLEGVFAGSFRASGDSWLLYSDFMWSKISADADVGPFGGNVGFEQEQILFTGLVGYELPVNVENMELYATGGLRYQKYKVDISIDPVFFPGTDRSGSQSWVDPIVGMALHYDINDRWFVDVMADVGGFGIASDITLQGTATVGYNWTDTISSSFGYRALYTDHQDGGFRYDATQHGLFTRLSFNF